MKHASGAFLDGTLYVGGGYTGSTRTDPLVYAHNFASGEWKQLPPCPMKWSTLSVLSKKLVLIGGRVTQDTTLSCYTNKVAVLNSETNTWDLSLPCMGTPKRAPIVIDHQGHLIAAGGNKGLLDYHAEVLHVKSSRWVSGRILPLPCLRHTSAVVGGEWYLLNEFNGVIEHTSLDEYLGLRESSNIDITSESQPADDCTSNLWRKMDNSPPSPPTRIASINGCLMAFSNSSANVMTAHLYRQDELWVQVKGRLPCNLLHSMLVDSLLEGVFYVLGGEAGHLYSSTAYRVKFTTYKELKKAKKERVMRLSPDIKYIM